MERPFLTHGDISHHIIKQGVERRQQDICARIVEIERREDEEAVELEFIRWRRAISCGRAPYSTKKFSKRKQKPPHHVLFYSIIHIVDGDRYKLTRKQEEHLKSSSETIVSSYPPRPVSQPAKPQLTSCLSMSDQPRPVHRASPKPRSRHLNYQTRSSSNKPAWM